MSRISPLSPAHNHNAVYATASHDHDSDYLGITATAADSDKIDGAHASATPTANTIPIADANGLLDDWVTPGGAATDHGALTGLSDDDHTQYIKHSLATAVSDFIVASGAGAFVKKTLAEVKTILGLGSAAYTASTDYLAVAGTAADSHKVDGAHASATPTAATVPIADANGKLDGWVTALPITNKGDMLYVNEGLEAETVPGSKLSGSATADSVWSGNVANNVLDDNDATAWIGNSYPVADDWIYIDFGSVKNIAGYKLFQFTYNGDGGATRFKVQKSNDAASGSWVDIDDVSPTTDTVTRTLSAIHACQFVRFYAVTGGGNTWMVFTIEIYEQDYSGFVSHLYSSNLPVGAEGTVLTSASGVPAWLAMSGNADTLDTKHAADFLLIGGKAADSDLLDSHDTAYFATAGHAHDYSATYLGLTATAADSHMVDGLHAATSGADAHVLATDASGNAIVSGTLGVGVVPEYQLDVKNTAGMYALNLQSNSDTVRPGIRMEVLRPTQAGIAFSLFDFYIGNVNTLLAAAGRIGIVGTVMSAPTPSTGSYMFLDVRADGAYNNATLKIDTNNRVGVGLTGTNMAYSLLEIQGGLTTVGAVLTLSSQETSTVVNDILGRISFRAALDASATDARVTGASIAAIAENTFSASVNETGLIFCTAISEVATEKMRLDHHGNLTITAGFGCNGKAAQAGYANAPWAEPGAGAYGVDSAAHMAALVELVQDMQAALVANGILATPA